MMKDYFFPSPKAKRFLLVEMIAIPTILVSTFIYCKYLTTSALELLESNHVQASRDISIALAIYSTAITVVLYFIALRNIYYAFRGYKDNQWPPKKSDFGMKTLRLAGAKARRHAVKLALVSLPFFLIPYPWQHQAYDMYQQFKATEATQISIEEWRSLMDNCTTEAQEPTC